MSRRGTTKTGAGIAFVLQRARQTGEDRTYWDVEGQTKLVCRERYGERRICIWNKGRALSAKHLVQLREAAKIPHEEYVRVTERLLTVREDESYVDWYGVDHAWILEDAEHEPGG